MGLFEKKFCDICGNKIGLLGNKKLANGNMCGDCSNKLSPFFRGRKNTTVQDIVNQLAYREQNRQQLNFFNPTRVVGNSTKVYIDDSQRKFVVSRKSDYREANADIIDLSQVIGVRSSVEEHRSEQYTKDANGNRTSYNPPRYEYKYEINVIINVNSPYFNEIKFEVTDTRPDSKLSDAFRRYEQTANEIVTALGGTPTFSGNSAYNQQTVGYTQPNTGFVQQQTSSYIQPGSEYSTPVQNGYNTLNQQQQFNQQPQYTQQQQFNQQPQYSQQPQFNQQSQINQPQAYQQGVAQPQQQFTQQGFGQQFQQPLQNGIWVCPNCGMTNNSQFCSGCGRQKY